MKRMTTGKRQEQIIDTAMHIINNAGFFAFTTRRLAKEIGISEPALYRHFKSKDEILIRIIQRMDSLWDRVEQNVDNTADYLGKLSIFMGMHFKYISENRDIVAILFADENLRWNKTVKSYLDNVRSKRYFYLVRMYEEGKKCGSFRPLESKIAATIILGTIRATVLNWRESSYRFSLTNHGQKLIETFMKMIENTEDVQGDG